MKSGGCSGELDVVGPGLRAKNFCDAAVPVGYSIGVGILVLKIQQRVIRYCGDFLQRGEDRICRRYGAGRCNEAREGGRNCASVREVKIRAFSDISRSQHYHWPGVTIN
jgi:hypothetical protein